MLAGCASNSPTPVIADDLPAFSAGVDAGLQIGMPIKEARAKLREKFPPTSINSEVAPPTAGANRVRRFTMAWPTLTPGTTFVLTIFCDHEGKVVRWTTGPLTESR